MCLLSLGFFIFGSSGWSQPPEELPTLSGKLQGAIQGKQVQPIPKSFQAPAQQHHLMDLPGQDTGRVTVPNHFGRIGDIIR